MQFCFSCFIIARITFTSILYPQCTYMIYIICTSHSSYSRYKLNSHLTCFQQGFIAQSVEHRTGITDVMGSNPVEASEFFLGLLCNCFSVKITFTSILYPQCIIHDLYRIHIISILIICIHRIHKNGGHAEEVWGELSATWGWGI